MKKIGFYLLLISALIITSCSEGEDDGISGKIDKNNIYGGWISNFATSQNEYDDDCLYSIYINIDKTVEGYWYEGKDDYGLDEYSHFTGRIYISDNNLIIVANFSDEGGEETETWDDITILQLTSSSLKIKQEGFQITFSKTSNITPPNVISQNNIYGKWKGKAPADGGEYLESLTINSDNTISGRWCDGDGEYSEFSGILVLKGREIVMTMVYYDENGDYDETETWEDLILAELTDKTMVVRENGDEDEGELFSYINYCMYKQGGESLLPQAGDVYIFTTITPVIKNTDLTYQSNNRFKCPNTQGAYYIDLEAILTKSTGETFRYSGDIGNFSATPLGNNIFASVNLDMGYSNKYKIYVDPNYSSNSRTQQIEISYSYYSNQVSGTAIITIEQEAYQNNTGGGTGGSSTQVVTGKVNAVVEVIGPGLKYDSYAQYIDGKTDIIEYTYDPSTGKYHIFGGIYCSNSDANGGRGLRYEAQKGYNSITIYRDSWFEHISGSVVPIKYDWEARLKFTIP